MIAKIALAMVCALGVAATPGPAAGEDDHEEQLLKSAEPVLDNILDAMARGDYKAYLRDFDETARKAVDEERFAKSNRLTKSLLGDYKSRKYLGFLAKGGMTILLYKGRFTETDDDVLIKLVLSRPGDKFVVSGLWFQ